MQPKPGIQSTEFLALILLGATVVANGTAFVNIEPNTMNIFIGAVMSYIAQRGYVKSTASKVSAP